MSSITFVLNKFHIVMDKLTPEESALISYIEEQNPKSVSNLMDEKNRFKQIAQQQIIAQLAEFTPSVNEFLTERKRDLEI